MKHHHGRPWWAPGLSGRRCASFVLTIALCVLFSLQVQSQVGDLARPKQHLSIERPRVVSDAEALSIYQNVRERMHASYLRAEIPAIVGLCEWPLYNRVPYLSATHGQRYVNNYANALARTYGRYEQAGPMPVGAVLAKDSFTITRRGEVFAGALFVMEKMPAGFNPESHDWRYTMIMPDGSLFGTTKGDGSERVAFCISCHEAVAERHHQMFFVPREYRVENLLAP